MNLQINNTVTSSLVCQLDKNHLSVIYYPVGHVPSSKINAVLLPISEYLKEFNYKHILIPVRKNTGIDELSIHQLDKSTMNIINVPVGMVPTSKVEALLKPYRDSLHENGYQAIVIGTRA